MKEEENLIEIPKLGIKIEKSTHHIGKSYDDLKKEFGKKYLEKHLPTYSQLQFLRNLKRYRDKLGLDNTHEFILQEDLISKKKGYVTRFDADSGSICINSQWLSSGGMICAGVRFVFPIGESK